MKLLIRGNTPLTKLRDTIVCAADLWSNLEDFETPNDESYFFVSDFIIIDFSFFNLGE